MVIERETLRYSPAGLPVLNLKLWHESEQTEAGGLRKTEVTLSAVAAGPVAVRLNAELAQHPEPELLQFQGFLAASRSGSKSVKLHITEFEKLEN